MVPIPLLLSEGISRGDILIQRDGEGGHFGEDEGNVRAVLFLSMDALGEVMIDTGLTADRVSCLIRCENSDAADFVSEHLEN